MDASGERDDPWGAKVFSKSTVGAVVAHARAYLEGVASTVRDSGE